MSTARTTRRDALKAGLAAGFALPAYLRGYASAAPSETLRHASFGAGGMGLSDLQALTASPHLKLVAVADVDLARAEALKRRFPDVTIYQDWRVLLDKEKGLDSVNVSTPDHMHAPIALSAMRRGLHVYGQKPLAQTIGEARRMTEVAKAAGGKLVTQMGIQIHSHRVHKAVVATIQAGAIGKVKEVHSWSGKQWGDNRPRPDRTDPVPRELDWDAWIGVAEPRPFVAGYYHPGNWRKRLDFGTGTFGDMGCHILDPVFTALALTAPTKVRSVGGAPNADSWGLDSEVHYTFPGTPHTAETLALYWYDGEKRPPAPAVSALGGRALQDQGSVYIGTEGVLYSPYIDAPVLLPAEKFAEYKRPGPEGDDHYLQFVEACRGNGATSAPFSYAGPLTESILLGCLATRFPRESLAWDAAALKVTNLDAADRLVRRRYRRGWEVEGV